MIHELGHFFFAKLFHVTIHEFSIGMGPKIVSHVSKRDGIQYSLRALPIGGYVTMEGEDGDETEEGKEPDPNSFNRKPAWQRMIILAAGATMNILLGFLLMTILVCSSEFFASTTIAEFDAGEATPSYVSGLREGDDIQRVDGVRVRTANELVYEISRSGIRTIPIELIRDGKRMTVDVTFDTYEESGATFGQFDFKVYREEKNFRSVVKNAFYRSISAIKMVVDSLVDLVTGRYGVEAVSGVVGVVEVTTETAKTSFADFVYLFVVIAMNLGVFNLLPFPALDGGRILFLLIEVIIRRPVNQKVQNIVNGVGMILLLSLMAVITVKDVVKLFLR